MNQEIAVGTYFTLLHLINFRRFGDVKLDLRDEMGNIAQWTLLLGDNGVGKTTLLQCLAWMRPVPVNDRASGSGEEEVENEIEVEPAEEKEIRDPTRTDGGLEPIKDGQIGCALTFEANDTIESLFRIGAQEKFQLIAELWQGGGLGLPPATVANGSGRNIRNDITFHFEGVILRDESKGQNPTEVKLDIEKDVGDFWEPFILAYGANRWTNPVPTGGKRLLDELAANLSPSGTQLHDAEEELTGLQGAVNEQELEWFRTNPAASPKDLDQAVDTEEKRLLKNFTRIIVRLLPFVASESDIEINAQRVVKGEVQKAQVRLRIHDQPVSFSELSLGYQTTLTWALDFAWRLSKQYPTYSDPLKQPAIVLIDEVDLHLHPRWQWTIMRRLSELFPRTQFIATSHSPLMVQSMPKANFAIVQDVDGEIEIENTPEKVRGWRVDQILNSEYFGFEHAWDPETEHLFNERDELLAIEKRSPEQERRLVELEETIADLPVATSPEDREAMEIIREAAEILKNNPPHR